MASIKFGLSSSQGAKDGKIFNEQNFLQRAAKPASGEGLVCFLSAPPSSSFMCFHTWRSVHLVQTKREKNDPLLHFSSGPLPVHMKLYRLTGSCLVGHFWRLSSCIIGTNVGKSGDSLCSTLKLLMCISMFCGVRSAQE